MTAKKTGSSRTPAEWCEEVRLAFGREKSFREEGKKIVRLYEGAEKQSCQFNILYSNTETLQPALYNATPRPVVQRRFKDEDVLGAAVAKVMQRTLEFTLDPGGEEPYDFDDLMRSSVLEALLPGRGVTRFEYDAEIEEGGGAADASKGIRHEYICGKEVPWDRFCHGYAKKWNQVEWVCFEHLVSEHERDDNFEDLTDEQKKEWEPCSLEDSPSSDDGLASSNEVKGVKLYQFYEIWHKPSKKVLFCTPQLDAWLREVDDPYGLANFFPMPTPLRFIQKLSDLVPVPLYILYQKQAEELNTISLRITRLTKMLKVRGGYDSTVEDLAKVLEADDGTMVPMQALSQLYGQNKSLKDAVWIPEITEIVGALQMLYTNREACKRVIYEITGISDILRGASVASETATAQKIKDQWGTLRLRRMQKAVAKYVQESLRIIAELAANNYGVETFKSMTGLSYPSQAEKDAAKMAMGQFQMAAQAQAAQPPAPGQPPQEAPQPDPKLLELLSTPSWEEIVSAMQNSLTRAYKIDIETNSTVDAEATEDKQNISELLNAMAQFMSGVAPLVESGTMPFEAAQTILMSIVRRFRFGTDVEDALKKMKPPEKPDDGSAAKAQMEQKKGEMDLQMIQAKAQAEQQSMQMQAQLQQEQMNLEREKLAMQRQEMEMQMEFKREEHAMNMAALQAKTQALLVTAKAKVDSANAMPKPAAKTAPTAKKS